MSRVTPLNVVKVLAVFVTSFLVSLYLVLAIGIAAKNKKVMAEGAVYTGITLVAFVGNEREVAPFLWLLATAITVVRAFMLRDLWLPPKQPKVNNAGWASVTPQAYSPSVQGPRFAPPVQAPATVYAPPTVGASAPPARAQGYAPPVEVRSLAGGNVSDLSSALGWVSSTAKQNKHRMPAEAYVALLETCQTLDAIVDAEAREPSADARFEYELEAVVREYLPSLLRGYLAVPTNMTATRQPNGRTPDEELVEQIDLLSGQADALHSSRFGQTSADLTSMGNFLRERFGHRQRNGFDFGVE